MDVPLLGWEMVISCISQSFQSDSAISPIQRVGGQGFQTITVSVDDLDIPHIGIGVLELNRCDFPNELFRGGNDFSVVIH